MTSPDSSASWRTAAFERDRKAVKREADASSRDLSQDDADQRTQVRLLAAEARKHGTPDHDADASDRRQALADIVQRAANRDRAADDREHAALDRDANASDRERFQADSERAAANHEYERMRAELKPTQLDPLTGAMGRELGLATFELDIIRARRSNGLLVFAYIDVNNLEQVNDHEGHVAGDALLRDVASAIHKHLRPYDTLVRIGGDEFLCALGNCTSQTAQTRFRKIRSTLAETQPTTISVGYAQLLPEETLDQVTTRADLSLSAARRSR